MGTPLKNSKGVNKPFVSPFKNLLSINSPKPLISPLTITSKPKCSTSSPATSSFSSATPNETFASPAARPFTKLACQRNIIKSITTSEVKKTCDSAEEDQTKPELPNTLCKRDLVQLKMRVQNKEKELKSLNAQLVLVKKRNMQDLPAAIQKWRTACREVLEALLICTKETKEPDAKMSDILGELNIPKELVNFSDEIMDFVN